MKTQVKDQYHFNQASPSAQPGFEVFPSESANAWYFHGNDVDGQATLFSQGYSSADSAHRGLKTTLALLKKQRIAMTESPEGWFFALQSGNHQELARSRNFGTREEGEKMLRYFQQVASSAQPLAPQGASEERPARQPTAKELEQEGPSRYAFRLYFYPNNDAPTMTGRIEHIHSQRQKTFKGLDGATILQFIKSEIKTLDEPGQPLGESSGEQVRTLSGKLVSPATVQRHETAEITIYSDEIPRESAIAGCNVSLRNMDTQETNTLHNIQAQPETGGKVKINLSASALEAGTYHLNASVWLQSMRNKDRSITLYHLIGTGWLQLI